MKNLDFSFLKKTEFWATIMITIILAFVGGRVYTYYYGDYTDIKNNQNCIIDSPNSIQSINQQGGITAQKVDINTEKPERHFTELGVLEIAKFLPQDKNTPIQVWFQMGDAEARQYASEIKIYLEMQGWKVNPFLGSFLWSDPVVGVHVKNVSGTIRFEVGSKP